MRRWFTIFAVALTFGLAADTVAAQSAGGWWEWASPAVRADRPDTRSGGTVDRGGRTATRGRTAGSGRATQQRTTRQEDVRWDDSRRADVRYETQSKGKKGKNGKGPAFCRSGAGHPVHGMRWCYDKGFAGSQYDRYDPRWEDGRIGDVIFQPTRREDRMQSGTLGARILEQVLGRRVVDSLVGSGGGRGTLTGRWAPTGGRADALQLRLDGRPLAELTDFDRDGRVDVVLLNRNR